MGIKKEIQAPKRNIGSSVKQVPPTEDFAQEKQKLIDTIVALKSDNQKITFDLKTKQEECAKLRTEKSILERDAIIATTKITKLESNLTHMQAEYAAKLNENQKMLLDSQLQNETLSARTKQLQTTIAKNERNENAIKDGNDEYEVETIIDEKKIGKTRYYLLRWKGFGPDGDTWEKESNLSCPMILKKYLQTKKTK